MVLLLFLSYAIVLSVALARAGHRSRTQPSSGPPRAPLARVLIIGATGGTGRQLVTQALERGLAVTAFARDPSKLAVAHPLLTIVQGDVLDERSLDSAMRGQEGVLSALRHKQYYSPKRVLSEGTRNILRAMETHGVRRLVCATSLGIGDSAGRMGLSYTLFVIPVILPLYFWDKARQERLIAQSKLEWVIARPAALTRSARRGGTRQGRRVGSLFWTASVSRADVAAFMLDQLVSDTYLRTAPGVSS